MEDRLRDKSDRQSESDALFERVDITNSTRFLFFLSCVIAVSSFYYYELPWWMTIFFVFNFLIGLLTFFIAPMLCFRKNVSFFMFAAICFMMLGPLMMFYQITKLR